MTTIAFQRRLPVGAEVAAGGVHFRVWAPGHRSVSVVVVADGGARAGAETALEPDSQGHWSGLGREMVAGDRYWLRVDGGRPLPDPASRCQPDGPHGPSQVVDPAAYRWHDAAWRGPDPTRDPMYELHVGTYTREGTYRATAEHLDSLVDLGIGVLELLPLAEFPGRFGWGYDGVDLFAPMHVYGTPDDLRALVDRAHGVGLAVILDVVYNHFGPDGCYLPEFGDTWFSRRNTSEWGETPNFDEPGSHGVREFVLANARAWVEEFHLDGLRLDATQQIFDASPDHILAAITRTVRDAAGPRRTLVVGENEPQEARLVRPPPGGYGLDALWNDDLHHSARVALTEFREAYYSDYRGSPQELVSAAKHGFLFQGQRYAWQGASRGTSSLDLPATAFVAYLENHDQVANSAGGERLANIASPGRLRALTAYLLLGPQRPLLFMGQEWAASTPFTFFADHGGRLAADVDRGRREFLRQFPSLAAPALLAAVPAPSDPRTFDACRLDHDERLGPDHAPWLALHRDLLALRREWLTAVAEPTDAADATDGPTTDAADATDGPTTDRWPGPREGQGPTDGGAPRGDPVGAGEVAAQAIDGAVLGDAAFCLRFFARGSAPERLLVVNMGPAQDLRPAPEPLLAPPDGTRWQMALTTDDPRYGGPGAIAPETPEGWALAAESAVLLVAVPVAAVRP